MSSSSLSSSILPSQSPQNFEVTTATTVLVYIPCVTGTISFLCSCQLIYQILRRRRKTLKRVKERLLLGLSVGDLFFSAACVLSSFVGPSYFTEHYNHIPSFGNQATCDFQGFLYQLGIITPLYIACLCAYYYLVICCRKRDEDLLTCWEPLIHIVIWLWAIATAIIAVVSRSINFLGFNGCFVTNLQNEVCLLNPHFDACQRPKPFLDPIILVNLLTLPPPAISVLTIMILMSLIYCKVRETEKRGNRWKMSNHSMRSEGSHQRGQQPVQNQQRDEEKKEEEEGVTEETTNAMDSSKEFTNDGDFMRSTNNMSSSDVEQPSLNIQVQQQSSSIETTNENIQDQHSALNDITSSRTIARHKKKANLANLISETGALYVLGYLVSYIPTFGAVFLLYPPQWLLFVVAFSLPFQGFWNWAIYTRSRIMAILYNDKNDEKTWWEAFWQAVSG